MFCLFACFDSSGFPVNNFSVLPWLNQYYAEDKMSYLYTSATPQSQVFFQSCQDILLGCTITKQ